MFFDALGSLPLGTAPIYPPVPPKPVAGYGLAPFERYKRIEEPIDDELAVLLAAYYQYYL